MDSQHVSAIITAAAGITGVLLGNSFVAIKEALVTRKEDKRHRVYLAVLVVSHLDRFANGCTHVAYDDGTAEGRPAGKDGLYRQQTVSAPEFLPLDIDVEWKVLPQNLMYEILQIPDRRERIENQLANVWDFDDPPDYTDYFWTRRRKYAQLGLHVARVAAVLREHAGLPTHESPPNGWNRETAMHEVIEKVDSDRAAYDRRIEEIGAPNLPI